MKEFADAEMKESPDLINYIALSDEKHEKLNIIDQSNDVQMLERESIHLSESDIKQSIKQGNLFQGKIMFQPNNLNSANVKVYLFDKDVIVDNPERINRAYHGDIVCIEIFDEKSK
jgi:exoribonuclease R